MTFRFHAASATAALLTLLVACGKKSSTDEPNAEWAGAIAVPINAVIVARTACPDGFANASVCCTGGDPLGSQGPACESWPNAPFHPCPPDFLSYPDATSCCALDDLSHCVAVSAAVSDAGPAVNQGASCNNRCAPGFDGTTNTMCCQYLSDGGGGCSSLALPGPQLDCEFKCPTGWMTPKDPSGGLDDQRCCDSDDPNRATKCFAAVL